jgi:hypothetical protein
MVKILLSENGDSLRDQIFAIFKKNKVSANQAIKALSQCFSHITNRMLVEETAKECGLRLSRFLTNDALELYYDLKQGRHEVGYISKGWDDPGFRIGEIVKIENRKLASLKEHAFELLKFCATNGVTMTIEDQGELIELHMDSVIYSDGFNKSVFEQVLHHLNLCVEKAKELIGKR